MISSVQDNESRISQLFFQKSFPKPKEEPLLEDKKANGLEDGEAGDTPGLQASGGSNRAAAVQNNFAGMLRGMLAPSFQTKTDAAGPTNAKERTEQPFQDSAGTAQARNAAPRALSDELLAMKIRLQQNI